ncbi:MAG: hypothetical protein H6696_02230 [Deferribacteres bacterium]|nr:hypothetical protein [candidate division KSB1 bacterium]MCB9500731.1 hypothetical protein [Deferribacteres bacterium]
MKRVLCFLLIFGCVNILQAQDSTAHGRMQRTKKWLGKNIFISPSLHSYEPNIITYSYDGYENAEQYMNFNISIGTELTRQWYIVPVMTFAFSGRFGQYIGVRESSPVIAKRFNPKIVFKWDTIDLGIVNSNEFFRSISLSYAHESNGQSITSKDAFDGLWSSLQVDDPEATITEAKDYISRGWDYLELVAEFKKYNLLNADLTAQISIKEFLDNGLLQGEPENIYEFETWRTKNDIQNRDQIDGVSALVKWRSRENQWKIALLYNTGRSGAFEHHSFRIEGMKRCILPLLLYYSYGYGRDWAQYYEKVHAFGAGFEFISWN